MPTALDPEQAIQGGLLGSSGPVQVTAGPCSIDYYEYRDKAGNVKARTCAAIVPMSPDGDLDEKGNQKSYVQVYSIGDPNTHTPSPDKSTFEGPLVKGSNLTFFLENLINSGFPKHLLMDGNIKVLDGVVMIVEQKAPAKRNIKGNEAKEEKSVVVPVKVIHPAPGEQWSAAGNPAGIPVGGTAPVKAAAGPMKPVQKKAEAAPSTPVPSAPAATNGLAGNVAEMIVQQIIQEAGDNGFTAKDAKGNLAPLTAKATITYMKRMQKESAQFPPDQRAAAVALIGNPDWLAGESHPWVFDADSGLMINKG